MSTAATERPKSSLSSLASAPYRVQIVDDHRMMRAGLMALAQVAGRIEIDWLEAANLGDALAAHAAGDEPIDLVLLDLNLPDSQGLQGLRRFLTAVPAVNVAVFSATEDEFVVRQALDMGAVGFLPKSSSAENCLRLVESLLEGARLRARGDVGASASDRATTAESARVAALPPHYPPQVRARAATLTPTQLRVLELLLEGLSNQEIASECGLALGTVKNSVSGIFLALNVQSRSHLLSVFR